MRHRCFTLLLLALTLCVAGPVSAQARLSPSAPGSNTWATKSLMPTPRVNAASAVLNDQIYVMGGWTPHCLAAHRAARNRAAGIALSDLPTHRAQIVVSFCQPGCLGGSTQMGQSERCLVQPNPGRVISMPGDLGAGFALGVADTSVRDRSGSDDVKQFGSCE